MRPTLILSLALSLSAATAAHADTIDVFNFFGTPVVADPYTVSGSLTIDITSGVVQAASLTSGSIALSGVVSQSGPVVYIGTAMFDGKLSGDAGSFINYTGSNFDLSGLRPNEDFVGAVTFGSSSSALAAPEPSAILLTFTGVALGCLFWRKRLRSPLTASDFPANA